VVEEVEVPHEVSAHRHMSNGGALAWVETIGGGKMTDIEISIYGDTIRLRFPKQMWDFVRDIIDDYLRREKTKKRSKEESEKEEEEKYILADGKLRIVYGSSVWVLDWEFVKDLFDVLPEKSDAKTIIEVARERLGKTIQYGAALALMDFYADNVNFFADVVREGNRKFLVKHDFSLREENRKKMHLEDGVID